jgi:hypothetical protein
MAGGVAGLAYPRGVESLDVVCVRGADVRQSSFEKLSGVIKLGVFRTIR